MWSLLKLLSLNGHTITHQTIVYYLWSGYVIEHDTNHWSHILMCNGISKLASSLCMLTSPPQNAGYVYKDLYKKSKFLHHISDKAENNPSHFSPQIHNSLQAEQWANLLTNQRSSQLFKHCRSISKRKGDLWEAHPNRVIKFYNRMHPSKQFLIVRNVSF